MTILMARSCPPRLRIFKGELEMEEDADERNDREIESYLKKLEWAGIEIDRRRCRNNDLQQPTTAAGSDVHASAAIITPISSLESVPCSPNKALAISRIQSCAHDVVTGASVAVCNRAQCHSDLCRVQSPPSALRCSRQREAPPSI